MSGNILNVQRFCTHDGPGIRTTVFFKGCPLHCTWCHNPESQARQAEVLYNDERCVNCLRCVSACPNGQHRIREGKHDFDRAGCIACGKCTKVCPQGIDIPTVMKELNDRLQTIPQWVEICRQREEAQLKNA